MPKKLIAICSLAILLINLLLPLELLAQEQDRLTEMFNDFGFYVNNTEPGVYKSQTQGFISGGSLNVRAKYDTLRVGSITPPTLQAGCGGVDMFFGGVNFLSKQEYINMLKSIGQNALGYAFQLGLEAVCPTCNAVIKWLQEKASQFNKLSTDSCSAAKSLVGATNLFNFGHAEQAVESCSNNLENMLGIDKDEARKRCLTSNADLAQAYNKVKTKSVNDEGADEPLPGIAILNAMKRNFSMAEKTLLLNLFGTWVYTGPGDTGKTPKLRYAPRMISFKDLMYGKPDAPVYYPAAATQEDYIGLSNEQIDTLGDPMAYTSIPDTGVRNYLDEYLKAGGFVDKIKTEMANILNKVVNKTDFTTTEIQFINAMPAPVLTILDSTKDFEGVPVAAVDLIADIVAVHMIRELVDGYAKELIHNAHKQQQVKEEKYRGKILEVNNEMHQLLMEKMQNFESIYKTYQLADFYKIQMMSKVSANILKSITSASGGGK
jgi:conjugative transfer pilus assembly protein TraH